MAPSPRQEAKDSEAMEEGESVRKEVPVFTGFGAHQALSASLSRPALSPMRKTPFLDKRTYSPGKVTRKEIPGDL